MALPEPKKFLKISKLDKFKEWDLQGQYEIIKQVGAGSYGSVVEARQLATDQIVAIKRFDNIFEDLIDCKRILREITILGLLDHPNVVKIIDILQPPKPESFNVIYVVMDFCQSDLKKLFKSPIHLENIHLQTLIYEILCGMKYLHSAKVLHRDLKPANVLINEDCSVKICDFGLARSVEEEQISPIMMKPFKEKKKIQSQQEFSKPQDTTKKLTKSPILQRQNKMQSKTMKRELTGHVVTRWYRAPEVILLEKEYNSAIDIWSIGCIFAELQQMLKANAPTFLDRSPLFPGQSCFPLSPDRSNPIKKGQFPHSKSDQLSMIFSVLGTCQNPKEYDFVTDIKALEYIKSFNPKKKVNFKEIYPASTGESIDFLNKTICFNPNHRISINEALEHPLFKKVRNRKFEIECQQPIVLDFEESLDNELTERKLRNLFLEEIQKYHKK